MEKEKKGQGQAAEEGTSTPSETVTEDQGTQEQAGKVSLTPTELQSRIDREVTKALKTRTENLQREIAELKEALEKANREKAEVGLTEQEKLQALQKESEAARNTMKDVLREMKRLNEEIEALVTAEIESLCAEDRKIVEGIFPEDASPLVRLKVLRALKNGGKLSNAAKDQEAPAKGDVGSRKSVPNPAVDTEFQKGVQLGKELARSGKPKSGPWIPDAWKNR